ncbi:hypothetical protein FRAAL6447 [Frankia alni ACN14a]|uniref:Uncharacterized protein n=1 Tax=Frankia alni (strain DSM 45986 / CECT 9034 / ACN14a) TaxID=326424 RepID=Q0RBW0_FRAAA|nr:hypothetical protein FRAAL6447 [Frankia alni ACN14a]
MRTVAAVSPPVGPARPPAPLGGGDGRFRDLPGSGVIPRLVPAHGGSPPVTRTPRTLGRASWVRP